MKKLLPYQQEFYNAVINLPEFKYFPSGPGSGKTFVLHQIEEAMKQNKVPFHPNNYLKDVQKLRRKPNN